MNLKPNEYQCAECDGVFLKGWSDEEASKEYIETFPLNHEMKESRAMVCDDCYKKLV